MRQDKGVRAPKWTPDHRVGWKMEETDADVSNAE